MTQTWHDLLFAHWPVPPAMIEPKLPKGLAIDLFDGQAWLGVVPFRMSGIRLRGVLGIPTATAFPEINVRTYVVKDGQPGVFFFSLDAESRLAVAGGRWAFHLPYFYARMRCAQGVEWIDYDSVRSGSEQPAGQFRGRYRPIGDVYSARPNTLEHWLTERYCLYCVDNQGSIYRGEIHHRSWPFQPAAAEIEANSMAAAAGIALPASAPVLHFARQLDVLIWPLVRV